MAVMEGALGRVQRWGRHWSDDRALLGAGASRGTRCGRLWSNFGSASANRLHQTPPTPSLRTSAEVVEAATAAGDVTLPPAAAAAATLPPAETVAAAATFLRLPIRFESVAAEVNALALIHLLDFGSGFDALLLAKTGKGEGRGGQRVETSAGGVVAGRLLQVVRACHSWGVQGPAPHAPRATCRSADATARETAPPACLRSPFRARLPAWPPPPLCPWLPCARSAAAADAREAVLFGLLGMLMGGAPVEKAAWLREFSAYSIFQYFHVDASGAPC